MNKTIRLIIALAIVMMATSACKTKQKVAEIPAGANIEATAPKTAPKTETAPKTVTTPSHSLGSTTPIPAEPEVTQNENFSLAEGETNAEALKFKYHVVVGSFEKQANAKRLQTILNGEGNKAVVVVNETGKFRVLIASFNDYKEAHVRIKDIATRFEGAWVLVQK